MKTTDIIGLLTGLSLGLAFAWLQWRATVKYEKEIASGRLARIPGAMTRTAALLMGLVGIQLLLPSASLWWITAGLMIAMIVPASMRLRRMALQRR